MGGVLLTGQINKAKEIDVATVKGNRALATGVDRRAVERCKEAIEKLGVLHTPIVGATDGGMRVVLSGQCELTALRELGVKRMAAIEVDVTGDCGAKAKLALLLISLRTEPDALCEGLLLQEAVNAGVPRTELQTMLSKSASWVSNRISLVTRLDSGVYEMVRSGLIDARSAQEVARLPSETQFPFADIVIREGLPKSAIETLVAGYNDESCPDAVKEQMLRDPRAALKRMMDKRRAVHADQPIRQEQSMPPEDIAKCVKATKSHMATLCRMLYNKSPYEIQEHRNEFKELETELLALLAIIRKLVYPGKKEVEQGA
jgi:ParB-like chromosome segregation protein Spo0J